MWNFSPDDRLYSEGGFTVDPRNGNEPEEGWAVATGQASLIVDMSDPEEGDYRYSLYLAFMRFSYALVGGWLDRETQKGHLDTVEIVHDRDDAIALARERGEIAVYNLATGEEVRV